MASVNTDTYDNVFDMTHETTKRKVSASLKDGKSEVVDEGDKEVFKKAGEQMGKDSFLNLLVAQMRYQDPLQPAEDTQFVAQLAQFSQLEFTQNSTDAISSLASNMQAFMDMQTLQAQSITNASATPLLGKEVRVMEASFEHKGLTEKEFNVHLTGKTGTLIIRDKDDNVVAELEVGVESSKGGDTTVKWNGKDTETGRDILGGTYTIEVVNSNGTESGGYAYQEGMVTGVNFSSSGSGLTINGKQYGLGYLINVVEPEGQSAEDAASQKIYMESVSNNGANLEFVPEKYKTADLCNVAVLNDGMALKYVPTELRTKELCMAAVKQNDQAYDFIPENLKAEVLETLAQQG